MKLIVLRHGECWANAQHLAAGAGDNSFLTVTGVAQSDAAARKLARVRFDAIVSSPLRRAVQTAEIIRDHLAPNLAIETNRDFMELDIGEATDGPDPHYLAMERAHIIPPGGETYQHFMDRVQHGLSTLKHRPGPILLIAHEGIGQIIDCIVRGRPASEFSRQNGLGNAQFKIVEL
jgi:broad specificity phosphatase PhoE